MHIRLASQELSIQELNAKTHAILNKSHNDPAAEQDFRRICHLYESQSSSLSPSLSAAYQEYVTAYHKITSLYLFVASDGKGSLFIYDTENEREEVKLLKIPEEWYSVSASVIQIPNGELFCVGWNLQPSSIELIAFIIDRNSAIRVLPSKTRHRFSSAIYLNKSIYWFGSVDDQNGNTLCHKFNLDENRWINLVPMPDVGSSCHSVAFNGNILISGYNKNILQYSIDINSFSIIPYDFTKYKRKILIKSEERIYLIEYLGFIYESDIMNEYTWKQIAKSIITEDDLYNCDYNQFHLSYNKAGTFISTIDQLSIREYYKFDLKQKTLIQNGYYDNHGTVRRVGSEIEVMNCKNQIFELDINHAAFKSNDSLHNLGSKLWLIKPCMEEIKLNPSAEDYNKKGNAFSYLGRHLEAIDCYSEAIKLDPYNNEYYDYKGHALYKLGRKRESIECYNQALKLRGHDNNNAVSAYINNGENSLYDDLGKKIETIEFYNESIMCDPDNAIVYVKKGDILLELGRILEAIECYDEAIKLDSDYSSAYFGKGCALYKLGRNVEAIESYNETIKLNPEDNMAYRSKGDALLDMDRFLEAADSYKNFFKLGRLREICYKNFKYSPDEFLRILININACDEAIKLDPCNADNYLKKGNGLGKIFKTLQAIQCYNEAIKLDSENAASYSNKGDSLYKLGRHFEAVDCYNEAIKIDPINSFVHNQKGLALFELDRKSEAVECYDKSIELNPQFEDAYFNKGNALNSLGRCLEAVECYSEAVKFNHLYADAYFNKGCTLEYLGRNLEAVQCYEAALEIRENWDACIVHKGWALHKLGRKFEEIECYDNLIGYRRSRCNNPDIYIYKGNTLYDMDRKPEAMECYGRAIEIALGFVHEFYSIDDLWRCL